MAVRHGRPQWPIHLGHAAAERLAESVAVGPLVPHDRDVCPGRWSQRPRLLVIQSSCGRTDGPWRHLGSPYAADREIVSECLESWLEDRSAREHPVAAYVEEEFRGYLTCGLLCFGFARALCTRCPQRFVVAFSCKRRGVCVARLSRAGRGHGWPALPMGSPAGARAAVGDFTAEAVAGSARTTRPG